jgi:hypothetical protein
LKRISENPEEKLAEGKSIWGSLLLTSRAPGTIPSRDIWEAIFFWFYEEVSGKA